MNNVKKTLFISVGSTSTLALVTLINRLIDLDIYKSDESFKDMFIAIDTDDTLKEMEAFNNGSVAHTFGIGFQNSAGDNVPSHKFLRSSFRKEWTPGDMQIRASDLGVGGQRVKSFSTLEWKQKLDVLISDFYKGLSDTAKRDDCQIILVASTWGGTATGMFQNVADFIGAKIFDECRNNPSNVSSFYIMLAMPDFAAAHSVFSGSGRRYQGMENFVYLMRGIQQAGWRGSLNINPHFESRFIFPEFFDFPLDGSEWIPVKHGSKYCERLRAPAKSPLPAKAVIVIPSVLPGATSNTIAEELLLLVYMNALDQVLLPTKAKASGKLINIREDNPENVVIGINMVECQLEYDAAIRKIVSQRLYDSWTKFNKEDTKDLKAKEFVRDFLAQAVKKPQVDRLQNNVVPLLNNLTSSDPKDITDLKESVEDFVSAAAEDYYTFFAFGDDLFKQMDEYAASLPEKDLRRKAFYNDLVLKDVQAMYQELVDTWIERAKGDADEKVRHILQMIDRISATYRQLKSQKGRDSLVIKFCNGVEAVPKEYIGIAKEELSRELLELQELLLIKATIKRYTLKPNGITLSANWEDITDLLTEKRDECLNDVSVGENTHSFIKKVADPRLQEQVVLDKIRPRSSDLISLMKSSHDKVLLNVAYNKVCASFVKIAKDAVLSSASGNDFSMVSLAEANNIRCCSPVYQMATSNDDIPANMFHFYAKCAGSGDITWDDVENLGFSSFLRCKQTQIVNNSKVDVTHLDPHSTPGCGVWFDVDVNYNKKKLYGMWLGSVDLAMTFRDVLKRSYVTDQLANIQSNAVEREEAPEPKGKIQCHQTLFEKLAMGAVLGTINAKLKDKSPRENQELCVSIKLSETVQWSAKCTGAEIAKLGFLRDAEGCTIRQVNASLIRELMSWTRIDKNTGSCPFADALKCKELFTNLRRQELYVLQEMSLGPDANQIKLIKELITKLDPCISVTVSGE